MSEQTKDLFGKELFISHFEARAAAEPDWLTEQRRAAIQQFAHLDLPTPRDEAWRQTNIAPVRKTAYYTPQPGTFDPAAVQALIESHGFAELDTIRLVFVNGCYEASLSTVGGPEGATVTTLSAALAADIALAKAFLGKCADGQDHAFISLNTALFVDGAYIEVPAGAAVAQTVHLIFVTTQANAAVHPRNLIVAGRQARLTLLESYLGAADTPYLTNAVTEIFVDDEAHVDHVKLQDESLAAVHIAAIQSRLGRAAVYANHAISSGSLIGRNEIGSFLDGENIECRLNGLYMADGKQHLDTHTRLDHAKPNCHSVEIYKGILDGESSSVFTGRIYVHPQAQKTDAIQRNAALLLSDTATADTQPQLEIFADDVKCTHGATIGELDDQAEFYLRSRGISKQHARGILTYAFANDIVDQLPIAGVKEHLEALLAKKYRH